MDSDSVEEARKRAKTDFVFDFSKFTIDIDFWREAEAVEIQSLSDQRARKIKDSNEFKYKGWILRPNPGPYTEYQRLYVDEYTFNKDTGELEAKYCDLFCTHASDDAFLKLFKELQSLITWDMSSQDADKIVTPAANRYPDLQLETLDYAITDIISLKEVEETKKELVSFFAKLWQETVKKERDVADVLVHIKDNDAALYPLLITAIDDELDRGVYLELFERLKRGTEVAPRDEDLEDHIDKYFYPVGRKMSISATYASYVEEKMKVAANLGLE